MNEEEAEQQEQTDMEALEGEEAYEEPEEEEAVVEEAEPEAEVEEEEEEETPSSFTPPQVSAAPNADRRARLEAALGTELFNDLMAESREEAQALVRSSGYANIAVAQAAQQMPNLFKVMGPKLQTILQQHVPPTLQQSPKSVAAAMSIALLEEVQTDADLPAVLARFSKLAGSAPAPKPPKNQIPRVPAAQRTPGAGAAVQGGKGQGSAFEREVSGLMRKYDLTRAEAIDEYKAGRGRG